MSRRALLLSIRTPCALVLAMLASAFGAPTLAAPAPVQDQPNAVRPNLMPPMMPPQPRPEAKPAQPGGKIPQAEAKPEKAPPSLDELFTRLRESEDDAEAKGIANLIERRLDRSGSATADLLTERARAAMTGRDFALAAELMDRVTALEPGWSEGWNRRATVFWLLSDKEAAIADLKRALVLEPRHFEAWAALGRIYQSVDDKAHALEAFRRAAALHPRMEKLRTAIDRLTPDVDGRDL